MKKLIWTFQTSEHVKYLKLNKLNTLQLIEKAPRFQIVESYKELIKARECAYYWIERDEINTNLFEWNFNELEQFYKAIENDFLRHYKDYKLMINLENYEFQILKDNEWTKNHDFNWCHESDTKIIIVDYWKMFFDKCELKDAIIFDSREGWD